ncbi:hypothetical protein AAVH_15404, partial [Aphelenchoides avenae]
MSSMESHEEGTRITIYVCVFLGLVLIFFVAFLIYVCVKTEQKRKNRRSAERPQEPPSYLDYRQQYRPS